MRAVSNYGIYKYHPGRRFGKLYFSPSAKIATLSLPASLARNCSGRKFVKDSFPRVAQNWGESKLFARGRTGFDSWFEAQTACRGWFVGLVKNRTKTINADHEDLALAA
jgi:hypothetical protein